MANIGLIVDVLDGKSPSGIKVYTRELVSNLLKLDKDNRYFLIRSSGRFGSLSRNFIELPWILNRKSLDIVHEPTHLGPFFYGGKYKKVITIYDLSPLIVPKTRPKSYFTWLRHRVGLPILLKKVDAIITISMNTKKDLINWFNIPEEKIKVTYLAADKKYRPIRKEEISGEITKCPFILNVGTLEPRKNLVNLIIAFRICRERYGLAHKLVIIGNRGWKYNEIYNTIKRLGLEPDVEILENIDDETLVQYYNSADLFVYPSLYEGFGLPVLEAMQCGCPVVCSNTSSLPEVAGDAGLLISPYDAESMASAMVRIIGDKDLRLSMSKKGFEQAKKFSWEKNTKETIEVYESLL